MFGVQFCPPRKATATVSSALSWFAAAASRCSVLGARPPAALSSLHQTGSPHHRQNHPPSASALFVPRRLSSSSGADSGQVGRKRAKNDKSSFEYVKLFEADDTLVQNCWIVVRVDGLDFRRFSQVHKFQKPNDDNALKLMNAAGEAVMLEFGEIVLAFGQTDEFSFVLRKSCQLYRRRKSKIISTIVSLFTSNYVLKWPTYMPSTPLVYSPSFEGRAVLYPSDGNLRDYLSWRQADTHINNLHNTTFWSLVLSGGMSENEAAESLNGSGTGDKNEILFSRFGINYSTLPAMYRKGTILIWKELGEEPAPTGQSVVPGVVEPAASRLPLSTTGQTAVEAAGPLPFSRRRKRVAHLNVDMTADRFWAEHPHILAG